MTKKKKEDGATVPPANMTASRTFPTSTFPLRSSLPLLQIRFSSAAAGVLRNAVGKWRCVCDFGRLMDRWSTAVAYPKYHVLLFSAGSLLLPVVGLNKMGPKRGKRGGGCPPISRFVRWKRFVCKKCHSSYIKWWENTAQMKNAYVFLWAAQIKANTTLIEKQL